MPLATISRCFCCGFVVIDAVERVLDVLDGAEEDRAVDPQHLELRAVGQAGVGVEVEARRREHPASRRGCPDAPPD